MKNLMTLLILSIIIASWFVYASFFLRDSYSIIACWYAASLMIIAKGKWKGIYKNLIAAHIALMLTFTVAIIEHFGYVETNVFKQTVKLLQENTQFLVMLVLNTVALGMPLMIALIHEEKEEKKSDHLVRFFLSTLSIAGIAITIWLNRQIYPWTPF